MHPDALSPPEDKTPKTLSKGERLFNWLTYGGVAGLGVFIATIPLAYSTRYGSGANGWKRASAWLQKKGVSAYTSEEMLNTMVLGSIGNLAIVPIKIMEDHKKDIIGALNDRCKDVQDERLFAHDAPQTWRSLIKGRVAAYAAVFASLEGALALVGGKKFDHFKSAFATHVICKPLDIPTHIAGRETKMFRYGRIVALDVFATAAAATLLYVSSRLFAKKEKDEAAAHAVAPEIAAPARPARLFTETASPRPASFTESVKNTPASPPLGIAS